MASPSINWDDFENQALLVQELLSDPVETADCHFTSETGAPKDSPRPEKGWPEESPVFITKVAMPPTLIILSPETQEHTMDKCDVLTLTPVRKRSEDSNLNQESEIKTPLKDCTNIYQKDLKKLANNIVTPENFEKSQSTVCPSSAEFRKFLDDIMAASPGVDVFENAEETTENHCQLQVTSKTPESVPVVKVHARRGTYDLDEPCCDLSILSECESAPVSAQLVQPSSDLLIDLSTVTTRKTGCVTGGISDENSILLPNEIHDLQIREKYEVDKSDPIVNRQINNNLLQNNNAEILKGYSELRNGGDKMQNDCTEVEKNKIEDHKEKSEKGITKVQNVGHEIQSIEMYKDSNECHNTIGQTDNDETQKDITEVQKNNVESHKSITQVHKEKTEACKESESDSGLNASKPNRRLLCKNSNLRRPLSRFFNASAGVCVKSQTPAPETDHNSCLPGKPAGDTSEDSMASEIKSGKHEKAVAAKVSVSHEKREDSIGDVCEKAVDSTYGEQNYFRHAVSSVSSSAEKLEIPDAFPENESSAENQDIPDSPLESMSKMATALSDLPGKTTEKIEVCPSTVVLKKVPVSKLPLMRPGQMQSKLRRPSSGIASLQSHRAATVSVPDKGIIKSSTVLQSKPVIKQEINGSDLEQKKTQEAPRMLPKLQLRPLNKTSERSLIGSKVPVDQPKLETRVCEQEAVKSVQPQKNNSALSLEGTQPVASKLMCKPSVMKGSALRFNGKGPVKASHQIDGSRTVTKRTSPVKAAFSLDGSRTVTRDVHSDASRTVTKPAQPAGSRTVTRDVHSDVSKTVTQPAQPAGSRTVTKASDGPMSRTPKNRQSVAGTSDKFIAPRRLSNVFNKSSSLE